MKHNTKNTGYPIRLELLLTIIILFLFRVGFVPDPTHVLDRIIDFIAETSLVMFCVVAVNMYLSGKDTEGFL